MTARCTGVVLAGGLATRYGGRPKGLEHVGGRRVIDRVAGALAAVADDLLLVANDPGAAAWLPGVRVAPDVRPGCGSLGGIHAALVHAGGPVLVVAWDMPFVPAELLAELRVLGEHADAAVPESGSRRGLEPLCAYYAPACVPPIERRLDAGDLRVIGFYDDVRVARLDAERVRRYGDPALLFMNVNTPDELALAERHASTTDGGDRRRQAPR
ncbi:MAG TPA: molybdenum cofactor guanylyltransferase [Gemmatimonadaceae bacterium]|nr:molybdenum cofactor guanylyltransferase [Gemmatimonadaceae bacterium]